jgi:2-methylcitrate dehydratase
LNKDRTDKEKVITPYNELYLQPLTDPDGFWAHATEELHWYEIKWDPVPELEADKRAIGNAIEINFTDGSRIKEIVDYQVGHRSRRDEGTPLLKREFERYLHGRLSPHNAQAVLDICASQQSVEQARVNDMMDLFVV